MAKNNKHQSAKPVTEPVTNEVTEEVTNEVTEEVTDEVVNTTEEDAVEPAVEESSEPEPVAQEIEAIVANCARVRFRSNPSTEGENVLSELPAGTKVTVLDSSNPGWTRAKTNDGMLGWIMSDFLQTI